MKQLIWINSITLIFLTAACTTDQESTQITEDNKVESATILPYFADPTFQPHWIRNEESLADFHQIRPFHLTDQDGNEFTEKDVEGKVYIVDFFFATCGGICPKMTSNMAILQDEFIDNPEVLLLSHSVTPSIDTVEALAAYGDRNGIDSKKWKLLTGDRSEIYDLGRNYYFVEESLGLEKSEDDFLHTENFVLLDQNRRIRGIYNGINKTSVNYLIEDINTLLAN